MTCPSSSDDQGGAMRELIADLFITVDGYAAGRQAPAFFGYPGPELDGWIDEQLATPHTMVMAPTGPTPRSSPTRQPMRCRPSNSRTAARSASSAASAWSA